MSTEAERLRLEDQGQEDEFTRDDQPAPLGGDVVVANTSHKVSYPTAAQRFYWVIPQAVTGTEVDGGTATLSASGGGFFAYNLGLQIPPEGTTVVCSYVPYRWVFRYP